MRWMFVWLVLATVLGTRSSLLAQDPGQDTIRLPEISVSAGRETRSAFAIPLAITRVDAQSLFGRSGVGLDDALREVPGVFVQSRAGGTDVRIVIRGFGARGAGDRSNAGTSRGIRVLLDGVPETEPDGRTSFDNIDLASIASTEIIRSNASALYGNAAGGVISLSTLDPLADPVARAEVQAGGFGLRRLVLRATTRNGAGAVGASLVRTVLDGWRANSGGERWLATFSASGSLGYRTRLGVFAVATENAFDIPGPLTLAQLDADPTQANPAYAARRERRRNRLGRIALTVDHAVSDAHALSGMAFIGPKFLQRSERGTFRDFTRYHTGGNLVWRWTPRRGAGGPVFMAGVDEAWQDGSALFYSLTPEGGRGDTLRSDQREGAGNFGVFAQAELEIARRLTLAIGARYDAITYHAEDHLAPSLDARRTFAGISPKVGLSYRLSRAHSVYASLGGGVEAPAANETDPAGTFGQDTVTALNPLLEPIRSATLELGTRHLLPLGRAGPLLALGYDVALYHTRVNDEIVPYRGGRFYFTAGEARRSGVELGAALHAAKGFGARASVALSHHEYGNYVVDSVHYGVSGAFADYSGNRVVGVPGAVYSFGVSWSNAGGPPLMLRATAHGTSGYFVDDANRVRVPGAATLDVTAGLDAPIAIGTVGVRGFVTINNVLDRRYVGSAFLNPDVVGGAPVAFEPGLPRHLVMAISLGQR